MFEIVSKFYIVNNLKNFEIVAFPLFYIINLHEFVDVDISQISGEFVMVHAAYQSHLGQDYFFAPRAKLADGIIWLVIVKAGITRANLLQVNSPIRNTTTLAF